MQGPTHQLMDLIFWLRIGSEVKGGLKFGFSNWVGWFLELRHTRCGGKEVAHSATSVFPYSRFGPQCQLLGSNILRALYSRPINFAQFRISLVTDSNVSPPS